MKLLYTASSRIEAEIICGKLEAENIHSFQSQDDEGGLNPALQLSNGVKIFVQDEDVQFAVQVLRDVE